MPSILRYDVFISYRHVEPDRAFSFTLLHQLETAGYRVAIDERDFAPNENFLEEMSRCLSESRFTIAILSPRYFNGGGATEEALILRSQDLDVRNGRARHLIPVLFEKTEVPAWLTLISGIDFTVADPLVAPLDRLKAGLGPPAFQAAAIAISSPSPIALAAPVPYWIVYTRVTAEGVLDWDLAPISPYDDFYDPTDSLGERPRVTAILHFPDTEYLKGTQLKRFTAVIAICTLNPEKIAADMSKALAPSGLTLEKPASATHPGDREHIYPAMAASLGGAFVVAVAVPAALLRAGRRRPEISYQALCRTLLVPLLELHQRLGMDRIDIRMMAVGGATDKLKAQAKAAVRESLSKPGNSTVDVIGAARLDLVVVARMARYLVWAVERHYNNNDGRWLGYFPRRQVN